MTNEKIEKRFMKKRFLCIPIDIITIEKPDAIYFKIITNAKKTAYSFNDEYSSLNKQSMIIELPKKRIEARNRPIKADDSITKTLKFFHFFTSFSLFDSKGMKTLFITKATGSKPCINFWPA